jgi:hypothetical protein
MQEDFECQADDAIDRASYLAGVGKSWSIAIAIAADEYGMDMYRLAELAAERSKAVQEERRERSGRFTKDAAKRFLQKHRDSHLPMHARRAAALVFFETITKPRNERNIISEFEQATSGLSEDEWLIAERELYRFWTLLPPLYDPRPIRRTPITRESFMWPIMQKSAFYRWWPHE